MATTKQYDYLNGLTQISSVASGGATASFAYQCNYANQRVRSGLADGSYWIYTYDSLGQVISGHKFFADGTPVAGQLFDYGFDTIGNRTWTKAGGDSTGANQRYATYLSNPLEPVHEPDGARRGGHHGYRAGYQCGDGQREHGLAQERILPPATAGDEPRGRMALGNEQRLRRNDGYRPCVRAENPRGARI